MKPVVCLTSISARAAIAAALLLPGTLCLTSSASPPPQADLQRAFTDTVRPFLESYCVACHAGAKPMAQFDLGKYSDMASVVRDFEHWSLVLNRLTAREMPPEGAKQPTAESRQKVIEWIDAVRKNEARKNAGDPGMVLARRLSNAEYNYTIRDLDRRRHPAHPRVPGRSGQSGRLRQFRRVAVDVAGAAEQVSAGRARSGQSPGAASRDGIAFAPHPVLVETDRDKYCVKQIVDFYQRQNTDYADYFSTAWRYKHRAALGKPRATLADSPRRTKSAPKYLATVWRALEETKEEIGPLAQAADDVARTAGSQSRASPTWLAPAAADARLRGPAPQEDRSCDFPDLAVTGISAARRSPS